MFDADVLPRLAPVLVSNFILNLHRSTKTRSDAVSMQLSHEMSFVRQAPDTSTLSLPTRTFELAHQLANELGGPLDFQSTTTPDIGGYQHDDPEDSRDAAMGTSRDHVEECTEA